jgi:hypothetical protein
VNPDASNRTPYPGECKAAPNPGMLGAAYALFELGSCT